MTSITDPRTPGLRSEAVRQSNLTTVLGSLHRDGSASRSELVAYSGLTRSAVGALVGDLVELGFVREERAESGGSPGRPSPVVRARSEQNAVLAMEVLVDSVAVAAVGLGGVLLESVRMDRARDGSSVSQTVEDLLALTAEITASLDPSCSIYGIGVALAGLVRQADNMLVVAPNIGWTGIPLGDLVLQGLGQSIPVAVGNEADLGALAETRRGAASGMDDVLYINGEVGIGGGMICGGTLVRGSAGFAGEVGHMPMNLDGVTCRCGATGCWETEVGEGALLRRAGRDPDGGRQALLEMMADAAGGCESDLSALAEVGRWLGIGLSGLINLLNPQVIVLGGFLGPAHPFMAGALDVELGTRALDASREGVDVRPADLGLEGPLMGAAELAWEPVLHDPAGASRRCHEAATLFG